MALTSDIVKAALEEIRVVAQDDSASSIEMSKGVERLNRMIHAWKLAGVDVSHTDLEANDTFALDPEYEEGTIYLLAERLSHSYRRPPSFDADDFFRKIQAAYMTVTAVTLPTALTQLPSQYWPDKIRR